MMKQECNIDKIIKILDKLLDQLKDLDDIHQPKTSHVDNNIEQPSQEQSIEKRPSAVFRFVDKLKNLVKPKNKSRYQASYSESSHGESSRRSKQNINEQEQEQENVELIHKLQSDIRQMMNAFKNLTQFQTQMSKSLEFDFPTDKLKAILEKTDSSRSKSQVLKEIKRKIFNLKYQIPSLLLKQSSRSLSINDSQTGEGNEIINEAGREIYLPGLHVSEDFRKSSAFEEVLEKFESLTFTQMVCLLSFAVFPENKEVKRTMLMYWWIGEGLLKCEDSEDSVTRILDEFSAKGLLEPVENERKLKPNSYKMEPHVHSAVIRLAEYIDLFHLYSSQGKLVMRKTRKQKVCLVKGSSLLKEAKTSQMVPGDLKTIFNSSERYPDFTFKWFPLMTSLEVLYLGRWERTAKRHIEVESTEFLKNMKVLKNLRLASFQGISRIENFEKSICELRQLVILDLRACYNLEALPRDLGLLQNLIYLDVSECYMLDRMPKGIAQLTRLKVLKGFVISQSDDRSSEVKNLVNLVKLSVTVNSYSFTVENLTESLSGLEKLESLKISWGARFNEARENKEQEDEKAQKKKEEMRVGDGVSSKKEDGRNEKANLEGGKKQGEGETSPPQDKDMIHNKTDDKRNVVKEGDEDKGKLDTEEGKKHGEEISKSNKVGDGDGKTSPPRDKDMIHNKTADKSKVEKEGDGDKGKASVEEEKKHDEERSKSNKVSDGDAKTSPTQDKDMNKTDDKNKVVKEGDEDKGKDGPEEGKKHDEEISKANKVSDGDAKTSPTQDKDMIHNKTDDQSKVVKEGDGDKEKVDPEEGKKHDEQRSKANKVSNGDEKKSQPQDKDMIQNKTDDKNKMEKEGDEDNGKDGPKEGKKHDEERTKANKVSDGDAKTSQTQDKDMIQNKTNDKNKVEKEEDGDKEKFDLEEGKTSPPQEKDTIQNKTDDKGKEEKKGNVDKVNTNLEEGKKHDEERSKANKVSDGDAKTNPPLDKDMIEKNTNDKSKVEKEGDGDKGKVGTGEGNEHDEEISKANKVSNGDEKTSPPPEEDMIHNKTNDKNKVEKEGNRDKGNVGPEEGRKHDDDVEGNKKSNPSQESTDAIQNKPNDSKVDEKMNPQKEYKETIQNKLDDTIETKKVQEKRNGAKTKESDKTKKFGKKVSFSEPPVQKKLENHEKASPSRLESKSKYFKLEKWLKGNSKVPTDGTHKLPSTLKKLELECFPEKDPPTWLKPENLACLEKLSIKGGNLSRISISDELQSEVHKFKVQILRLKYLHEFKAEWKDLQSLFPEMKLLEKYKCPKVAFCPTDGNGVWRSPKSPNM